MFTINLNDLQFFSHHGIHEEERILGNDYEVNLAITIAAKGKITSLEQTVDYAAVFEMVKTRMSIPTALLETVAQDLAQQLYEQFKNITVVNISITKKNPPIENFQGSVGVCYNKAF